MIMLLLSSPIDVQFNLYLQILKECIREVCAQIDYLNLEESNKICDLLDWSLIDYLN